MSLDKLTTPLYTMHLTPLSPIKQPLPGVMNVEANGHRQYRNVIKQIAITCTQINSARSQEISTL